MKFAYVLMLVALLGACNRDESGGPAEKAGREIQDASKGKKP